jgi:tRNA-dihydrouridine synthase B
LQTATVLPAPYVEEVRRLMSAHLQAHYAFYGEYLGVRTARKHIGWYVRDLLGGEIFRQRMNLIEACDTQLAAVDEFFESQLALGERLQYAPAVEKLAA